MLPSSVRSCQLSKLLLCQSISRVHADAESHGVPQVDLGVDVAAQPRQSRQLELGGSAGDGAARASADRTTAPSVHRQRRSSRRARAGRVGDEPAPGMAQPPTRDPAPRSSAPAGRRRGRPAAGRIVPLSRDGHRGRTRVESRVRSVRDDLGSERLEGRGARIVRHDHHSAYGRRRQRRLTRCRARRPAPARVGRPRAQPRAGSCPRSVRLTGTITDHASGAGEVITLDLATRLDSGTSGARNCVPADDPGSIGDTDRRDGSQGGEESSAAEEGVGVRVLRVRAAAAADAADQARLARHGAHPADRRLHPRQPTTSPRWTRCPSRTSSTTTDGSRASSARRRCSRSLSSADSCGAPGRSPSTASPRTPSKAFSAAVAAVKQGECVDRVRRGDDHAATPTCGRWSARPEQPGSRSRPVPRSSRARSGDPRSCSRRTPRRPKLFPRKLMRIRAGAPVDLDDLQGKKLTPAVLRQATDAHHGRRHRPARGHPRREGTRRCASTRSIAGVADIGNPQPTAEADAPQVTHDRSRSSVRGRGGPRSRSCSPTRATTSCCWARREELSDAINAEHENRDYLPGIALADSISATHDPEEAFAGAGDRRAGGPVAVVARQPRALGQAHRRRRRR